jgi:hypothetical protein
MAAGRVRVQIATDETQLHHTALQFRGAMDGSHPRRLRQLTHADEVIGIQIHHPVNEIVAGPGPTQAGGLVAHVMRHGGGTRRENRQVRTARPLQLQLRIFQTVANLVVADRRLRGGGQIDLLLQARDLRVAECLQRLRRGRVVAMAIDDHRRLLNPSNTAASDSRRVCARAVPRPDRSRRTNPPTRRRSAYPS